MLKPGNLVILLAILAAMAGRVGAQSFGVETHNTLMPASGAMGGTSIAEPQDVTSAINGNPANLTQFEGTQFTFSGAWAEPTFNLMQTGPIPPIIAPFSGKAENQGVAGANIGVSHSLGQFGIPMVFGVGFFTTAAGGADFRQFPESNGTNSALDVFNGTTSVAWMITDRLSVGSAMSLGIAMMDGPYVGIGGMSYDYGIRGTVGTNYALGPATRLGVYYQTVENFTFDNAIRLNLGGNNFDILRDIEMSLPDNVGYGISDSSLLDGRLLLAADMLYKNWDNTELFGDIYRKQWVLQLGAQLSQGRIRYRLGYVYAQNPLASVPNVVVGGIPLPNLTNEARYLQAQMAVTPMHRLSGGIGIQDVIPNMDLDMMVGGMFKDTYAEGPLTSTSVESYWVGFGLTWRFGAA